MNLSTAVRKITLVLALLIPLGGASTTRADVIADSIVDFSLVQKEKGWEYGYYASPPSSAFTRFSTIATDPTSDLWGTHWAEVSSKPPWTALSARGSHPNGRNNGSEHWAVRRWVSTIAGAATISGSYSMAFGNCGDGTTVRLVVDGVILLSKALSSTDTIGSSYSFPVELVKGSIVDVITAPGAGDGCDATLLSARVTTSTASAGCQPDMDSLCLANARFHVKVRWRDFAGNTGAGKAARLTTDTGYFWFFSETNVELVVKVLDQRSYDGHFWVFYGALSNVEYILTVTDTVTGAIKTYFNPLGDFGSVGDTGAFAAVAPGGIDRPAEIVVRETSPGLRQPSGATAESPWPLLHGNAQRTGQSPYYGPLNPLVSWGYFTGMGFPHSPVVAADGRVYVSSEAALLGLRADGVPLFAFGTGLTAISPALGPDGTVYVGTYGGDLNYVRPSASGYSVAGRLYPSHFGASGTSSPAIGPDGTLYHGSDGLVALRPDGVVKWKYLAPGLDGSPALAQDGTVYIGSFSPEGRLYAIAADGSPKWSYATGGHIADSPAVAQDGTVYVGAYNRKLYALTPNGVLKWVYTTGAEIVRTPAVAADGTIYFGSDKFYALRPDGTLKWTFDTGGQFTGSAVIGADGTVYVSSSGIFALDPTGRLLWKEGQPYGVPMYASSAPAIGSDGTLYVIHSQRLWALRDNAASCSAGPESLCLGSSRFRVEASWRDFAGRTGRGHAVPLTADTGYFWFFDQANVELVVKVLDQRSYNGHFWLFYGALSNVEYQITVTDTVTGARKIYDNPIGNFGSVGDTDAFTPDGCQPPSISRQPESISIASGASATLSVQGQSGFELSHQWYAGSAGDDSNPLSGATSSAYTTPPLFSSRSYWVAVRNRCAVVNSNTAVVTVAGPACRTPTITTPPTSVSVPRGSTATLTVAASGDDPLSFRWYEGAAGDTSAPVPGATNATMTTPVITTAHTYWVRVTNACGSVDSSTATVSVAGGTVTGSPFRISSGVRSATYPAYPFITSDANGTVAVAWNLMSKAGTSVTRAAIKARLYDLTGTAKSAEAKVDPDDQSDCTLDSFQAGPAGSFFAVWQTGNFEYMRSLDGSGQAVGSAVCVGSGQCGSGTQIVFGDIAFDQSSLGHLVWHERRSSQPRFAGLVTRIYQPASQTFGARSELPLALSFPRIAVEPGGGRGLIVFRSEDYPGANVYATTLLGSTVGQPFQVNTSRAYAQVDPAVACNSRGRCLVSWRKVVDGGSDHVDGVIMGRLVTTSGSPVGDEIRISPPASDLYPIGTQHSGARVAALTNGDFVVTWIADQTADVIAVKVSDGGQFLGPLVDVSGRVGFPSGSSVTGTPGGGYAVAWTSSDSILANSPVSLWGRIFGSN